jgi:hypothetical protein
MPLNPYFDTRNLVIRISNSPHDDKESLHTLYVLDIPHEGEQRDEIFNTIEKIMDQSHVDDGIRIQDNRNLFEAGASNSSQEFIFTLWEAILGGTVEAIVDGLIKWAAEKHRSYSSNVMMSAPNRTVFLKIATQHLKHYYGASGNIVWEEEEINDDTFDGKAKDSHGNGWKVTMQGESFHKIVKIR